METICMGCMRPLSEGETKCAHCGYPVGGVNPPEYLKIRTVLGGRYLVGRVLEIGGDSAVYIGYDLQEQSIITLREFFPATLCQRTEDGTVVPAEGKDGAFGAYRNKFLTVARTVARLRDVLVVVPSYDIFEENGTAYTVSEFCEGISLEKYVVANGGHLPAEDVRRLFLPLLSALTTIHGTGLLHLGISPKNILVDEDGNLRLKNFAIPETRTANTVCKSHLISGYAAPEQYEAGTECTAAADVYGVAASMFFALTGHHPADASGRGKKADDLMMPTDIADATPAHIKDSLLRALRVHPARRTQTVQQLLDELTATSAVAALLLEDAEMEEQPKKKGKSYLAIVFIAVFTVFAIVVVLLLNQFKVFEGLFGGETTEAPIQTIPSMETTTSTTGTSHSTMLFEVDNLVGRVYAAAKEEPLTGQMTIVLKGSEYSETAEKGTILSQTPAAGERVERGTAITVVISAGQNNATMPDVIGWKEEHARLYLEALGYTVADSLLLQGSDLDLGKGYVERTTPKAGEPMEFGDTVVLSVVDVE